MGYRSLALLKLSTSLLAIAAILSPSATASAQWGPFPLPPPFSAPAPAAGYGYGYGPQPAPIYPPPPPADPWRPEAQETRIGLETDWFHSSVDGTTVNALAWDLTAQWGLTDNILLDADIPWAFAAESVDTLSGSLSESKAVFGNPSVGAHFGARFTPKASFFVGLAIGIPALGQPGDLAAQLAQSYAAALRGFRDAYRFLPSAFPILFRGGVEVHFHPFFFRADLVPTILVSLSDRNSTAFLVDQANELGARASFGLLGGLRFQETFILTDTSDHAQTSLEPFVGYESPKRIGLFARYGLLMPLDPELGFAFDKHKILTSRLTIGVKL